MCTAIAGARRGPGRLGAARVLLAAGRPLAEECQEIEGVPDAERLGEIGAETMGLEHVQIEDEVPRVDGGGPPLKSAMQWRSVLPGSWPMECFAARAAAAAL